MENYRTTSHSIYDLKYHVCWVTKYRYPVLTHEIAQAARDLIRQMASSLEIQIITGAVGRDHIHLFVSVPPNISVSKMMQQFKGASSHKLQQRFPQLKKRYWGQHLWARGYFAVSSGNVMDEMWLEYISNQEEKQDPNAFGDFQIKH